jgi:drug/metabolite transporter (DMT)-like permease
VSGERAHRVALFAAVFSVVLQSLGPIFVRKAGLPGLAFAFYRMALAAAVYAVLAQLIRRPLTLRAIRSSIPGGLCFAFNIATFFIAVQRTSVANATIIGALQPVALLMVVNRLFGERPTTRDVVWTVVSIGGVGIVVLGSSSADTGDPVGDLFAFAAMLGYAAYYVASMRARTTLGTIEYQSALSLVALVVLTPVVFIAGTEMATTSMSWFWLAAMVALPGSGHLLTNFAHPFVRLSLMSVLTLFAPVGSTILAWALLDEKLVPVQLVGMVITIGALAVMVRAPRHIPAPRRD